MSEWIDWEWSDDKPYPETLDTLVYVKTRDGWTDDGFSAPASVGWWYGSQGYESSWDNLLGGKASIVAYRVVG